VGCRTHCIPVCRAGNRWRLAVPEACCAATGAPSPRQSWVMNGPAGGRPLYPWLRKKSNGLYYSVECQKRSILQVADFDPRPIKGPCTTGVELPLTSPHVVGRFAAGVFDSPRQIGTATKQGGRICDHRNAATRAAWSAITRALSNSAVPAGSPLTSTLGLDHTGMRGQPPQLSL
jgi:hypothetical protein